MSDSSTQTIPSYSFAPLGGGEAVTEYITRYRRNDVPLLEVAAPLDLFPARPFSNIFCPELNWSNPWPFGDRAGVYLVYSDLLELIYIGKAHKLGARLYQYFGEGTECVLREEWGVPPRFVLNIAVPKEMAFEAPALEAFLIQRLQPRLNTHGL